MAFIRTTRAADATGATLEMYQRQQGAWGYVPDYAKVFCHRPEVMARWGRMLAEIRRPVDTRCFELVTFAVAHELKHSSCALAHGNALAGIIGKDEIIDIANGDPAESVSEAEIAMMEFARDIASDASGINSEQVENLREQHGFKDEDIFDIAAIAAARCFFTKLLDALGSEPDAAFMAMDGQLRQTLTVGRAINQEAPEKLPVS